MRDIIQEATDSIVFEGPEHITAKLIDAVKVLRDLRPIFHGAYIITPELKERLVELIDCALTGTLPELPVLEHLPPEDFR
jgi:hypothetical protein